MTTQRTTSTQRSAEVLSFAVDRAETLSAAGPSERPKTRWGYEAAAVGELSALAALSLLAD